MLDGEPCTSTTSLLEVTPAPATLPVSVNTPSCTRGMRNELQLTPVSPATGLPSRRSVPNAGAGPNHIARSFDDETPGPKSNDEKYMLPASSLSIVAENGLLSDVDESVTPEVTRYSTERRTPARSVTAAVNTASVGTLAPMLPVTVTAPVAPVAPLRP